MTVQRASPVPDGLPRRLTAVQMQATLEAALDYWRGRVPRDGVWIFGYGSLIWNPDLDFDRRVQARVFGYHRRLCLRSVLNRGSPQRPGLVAGLDRGGSCAGIAYRLPARGLRAQFERLWEREMFMGSYAPRWLDAHRLDRGGHVRALAFVVRRDAFNYCREVSEAELIEALARATGRYGSSLEYLLHTVEALRAEGLHDPHFERLASRVRAALATGPTPAAT
jgi:cation transport protein ChaC